MGLAVGLYRSWGFEDVEWRDEGQDVAVRGVVVLW